MACHRFIVASLLLGGLVMFPHAARAAESYDNCGGYIDALPATISTGGTWCLRQDLTTNIASGQAIAIETDNVTIDCNDFKIGGLAAGNGSDAIGIGAIPLIYTTRRNIAIRHCSIRGFSSGIFLQAGIGHLIEDNRLDNNLKEGINTNGCQHCRVRRNAVFDTGGHTNGASAYGIIGSADIVDNIVDGVLAGGDYGKAYGINASGGMVSGNRIGGLASLGAYGKTYGIDAGLARNATIAGNRILAATMVGAANGFGIAGGNAGSSFCTGNTIANFAIAMNNCADDGGNAVF